MNQNNINITGEKIKHQICLPRVFSYSSFLLIICLFLFINFSIINVDMVSADSVIPEVEFIFPLEGVLVKHSINVVWDAWDLDGSELDIFLYYSNENSENWTRINSEPLENDGIFIWDCSDLMDGHYFMFITAVNSNNQIGHGNSGLFTIDNDNSPLTIRELTIKDTTINSEDYVKNGDNVEISATISYGSYLEINDILADLSCFNIYEPTQPDSFDGTVAVWIINYVSCSNPNGVLKIDVEVDRLVQKSQTIISDHTSPNFEIKSPINGFYFLKRNLISINSIIVVGVIPIDIAANDNYFIKTVDIYLDDTLFVSFSNGPYAIDINERLIGFHTLKVKMRDGAGNSFESSFSLFCYNLFVF